MSDRESIEDKKYIITSNFNITKDLRGEDEIVTCQVNKSNPKDKLKALIVQLFQCLLKIYGNASNPAAGLGLSDGFNFTKGSKRATSGGVTPTAGHMPRLRFASCVQKSDDSRFCNSPPNFAEFKADFGNKSYRNRIDCLLDYLRINWAAKYLESLDKLSDFEDHVLIVDVIGTHDALDKGWRKSVSGTEGSKKTTFGGVTLGA